MAISMIIKANTLTGKFLEEKYALRFAMKLEACAFGSTSSQS
jgi:hypothetical protein